MNRSPLPFLWAVWGLATACFIVGVFSPIMSIRQLYIFEDQFSVISALFLLVGDGQVFLAVIIGLFSLAVPLLKLCVLAKALSSFKSDNNDKLIILDWMHRFGRWSMLDVFVVAILIVGVKLSAFASVELHTGLWAFSLALLLLLVLTSRVQRLLENRK